MMMCVENTSKSSATSSSRRRTGCTAIGGSVTIKIILVTLLLHLCIVGYTLVTIQDMEKFSERLIISNYSLINNSVDPQHMTDKLQYSNNQLPENFLPWVYQRGNWDIAPIVVEKYNLLFFTQGKVACTEFKKLLRRMMNLPDWQIHKEPKIPHNPAFNGLKYLYHYPLPRAMEMLTDPKWTRAIFVREPRERFLSAFLDKAAKKDGYYVDRHCCMNEQGKTNSCGKRASKSLKDFITVVREQCCCDAHWKPQSRRIDQELWPYVNFVGYFDTLHEDGKRLLERLGDSAWDSFGSSGWGTYENQSMFFTSSLAKHRTNAHTKLTEYFNDTHVLSMIEDFYADDYRRFNFSRLSA